MKTKKILITILILIVLIIAAGLILNSARQQRRAKQASAGVYDKTIAMSPRALVPNFPDSLVLDKNAAITDSRATVYGAQTQYTASYFSTQKSPALAAAYVKYFNSNGYTILNNSTANNTTAIFAVKNGNQASITLLSAADKTRVSISYMTK